MQILEALFAKPTPDVVNATFDTDIAIRANRAVDGVNKRSTSPSEMLMKAVSEIRSGAIDLHSLQSLAMSASSLVAATSALKRAHNAGRVGKGMLKRAAQRTAGVFAMRAATAAAVTGTLDGVHGADPLVVQTVCDQVRVIFQNHGAVHLQSPLLRPRRTTASSGATGGPAELLNQRGAVLLLPEDLTASFGTYSSARE